MAGLKRLLLAQKTFMITKLPSWFITKQKLSRQTINPMTCLNVQKQSFVLC